MDYFTRSREDGKYDVLEGSEETPGRIVTTLDTEQAAHQYIDELVNVPPEELATGTVLELADVNSEDTMPYHIEQEDGQYCIHKGHTGEDQGRVDGGCHESRDDAIAHLRALYANEADKNVAAAIAALEPEVVTSPLTAHAEPAAPPADFFTDPHFTSLQRYVTITADGRFMTHVAGWGECHVGYGDMCVTAPREADYSHFAVGTVLTSDGTTIPTGVIALKGGHADPSLDASSARSHYDDPSSAKVDVVLGTDEFGIWASGAIRVGTTPEDIAALRASGVSGDWRLIDGQLRLVGICAVNVPGFPKLTMAASADGISTLIAAGGLPVSSPDCNCDSRLEDVIDELDSMHRLIAAAGIEDTAVERLFARIADDSVAETVDEAELDALYARIDP